MAFLPCGSPRKNAVQHACVAPMHAILAGAGVRVRQWPEQPCAALWQATVDTGSRLGKSPWERPMWQSNRIPV